MTGTRRAFAGSVVVAVVVVVVVAIIIAGVVGTGQRRAAPVAAEPSVTTAKVVAGPLSATVAVSGTLTYRAQADGSPYVVINHARGTYTGLPDAGTEVACGAELYRVDDRPVLLLCGALPAYRDLREGDQGRDVVQLNANLHAIGGDVRAGVEIDPGDGTFTDRTTRALARLQQDRGAAGTGELSIDGAVYLPEGVRVATVVGGLGAAAQPGAPVLEATSDTPEVQVALAGSEQGAVTIGDRARITLPSNASVMGTVGVRGTVAQAPAGPNGDPGPPTIPVAIGLDDPAVAEGLDQASVRVEITTQGVDRALSVPVTAIVGRSGGGFAVEVVRDGGRRQLVAVTLGLFDTGGGRVQVEGELGAGDDVVVPSA